MSPLAIIKKSDGVAFTGQLQNFFNHAPIVKFLSKIEFSPIEQKWWDKLFSYKDLGNNLFAD